jgi:3-oxoacyl-[acyl-carrier protein] reductase
MSLPLSGKIALVTGASKGIGASTATALVSLGAKVVINYNHGSSAASSLVSRLGEDNAIAVQADAGSITGIETLVNKTVSKFGHIDILIPNAGILPMKDLESTTEADFDAAFNLNVKGPYFLIQKALPHMSRGGSVVLISTTQNHASTVTPGYGLYCATKGAIEQMVRVLSKELLAKKGVKVNAVAPGPTGTDLFYEGKSEQMLKMIANLNPNARIGTPEEVADAIVFLCRDEARWVSGQTIRVNGGQA